VSPQIHGRAHRSGILACRPLALLAASAVAGLLAFAVCAAEAPDDVLVENALVKVTRADYDAWLARIPEDLRFEFATSPKRLTSLLNNILVRKTLAARAQASGLQPDFGPPLKEGSNDLESALANAEVRAIETSAAKDFDAKRAAMLATARENYLLDKKRYQRPEQVKLSAILISSEKRGDEAALALARETRAKLASWAEFSSVARDISEDKASAAKGGSLDWASAADMDPALAKAAFALNRVGEISEPVHVGTSYILLRLDERRPAEQLPFDEVKDQIMDELRANYIKSKREAEIAAIRTDPKLKVDQAAVDGLVHRVAPEEIKRATGERASSTSPPAN
jgi:peptidyl-prolyl cis-trans isomerase C